MRRLLQKLLLPLAAAVLRKYQPLVIAVTGTVGKTGTKNAIAAALAPQRRVRASAKNNNTEIGVAVTVLGVASQGRSVIGWIGVLLHGLRLLIKQDASYPAVLVL